MRKFSVVTVLVAAQVASADPLHQKGVVTSAHPLASQAGQQMLMKGGNAFDAAVAAAFVLAVVTPYHSGIGGGGFAVGFTAKDEKTRVLDFREVAPKGASRDMFLREPGTSTDGALSVAVPGAVAGYLELLEKHGKLKPSVVLAPAIKIAREGFGVTPKYQHIAKERAACLAKNEDADRIFLRAHQAPGIGAKIVQPELARTLELIARQGKKAFYAGPIAKAIAATVKAGHGVLGVEDLAAYRTTEREPLWGSYRGYKIATMPPPSAGGIAVLQTLGVMERLGPLGPGSRDVATVHGYLETLRRVYVDRAQYVGDPKFVEVPVERLLSSAHLDELKASIDFKKATASSSLMPKSLAAPAPPDGGKKNTSHVSALDVEGNAVALTTTVNYWFGSCVVAEGTGILLNDQMDDFASAPGTPNVYGLVMGEANAIAPGKIPVSSMSPTLVFTDTHARRVWLAAGSPGGSTIPTTVIQVLSNVIDGRLSAQQAVTLPRLHHQWMPDHVTAEHGALDPLTAKALEALGHKLSWSAGWGDAELAIRNPDTGLFTAGADPRNEGDPAGW